MNPTVRFLLTSRRVWIAVFALIQALVLHYLKVPDEIWQTVVALAGALIAAFTVDDAMATAHGVDHLTGKPKA